MATAALAGWFVDRRGRPSYTPWSWHPVFDAVAMGRAIDAVCWLCVDATRSIVDEEAG